MDYNLNLDSVVDKINSSKAKLVCLQLPEGLKPRAKEIQDLLESKTKAKVVFWSGSCFGACDVPTHIDKLGFDLLFQWGHSGWV
jgi:diphthamide biosynthesis enzyme Dph1/Dph2-like protein